MSLEESSTIQTKLTEEQIEEQIKDFIQIRFDVSQFEILMACLQSDEIIAQYKGLIGLVFIFPRLKYQQLTLFWENEELQLRLIDFIKQRQYPDKGRRAFKLISLFGGYKLSSLYENGIIDYLFQIIDHNEKELFPETVKMMSFFLKEQGEAKDRIIQRKGVKFILRELNQWQSMESNMYSDAFYNICQYCVTKPLPSLESIEEILIFLCRYLQAQYFQDADIYKLILYVFEVQGADKPQVYRLISNNESIMRIFINLVRRNKKTSAMVVTNSILTLMNKFCKKYKDFTSKLVDMKILDFANEIIPSLPSSSRSIFYYILVRISSDKQYISLVFNQQNLLKFLIKRMSMDNFEPASPLLAIMNNLFEHEDKEAVYKFYENNNLVTKYLNFFNPLQSKSIVEYGQALIRVLTFEIQIKRKREEDKKIGGEQNEGNLRFVGLLETEGQMSKLKGLIHSLKAHANEKVSIMISQIEIFYLDFI